MSIKVKVKRKNPDWTKRVLKKVKGVDQWECAIGFPKGTGATTVGSDGESALDKAVYNNFGTSRIPARPFMDLATPAVAKAWKTILSRVRGVENIDIKTTLEVAGIQGVGLVQIAVDETNYPPNAPSTVKQKKSAKPLIDTGEMRQSVTYIVRGKQ